jgi:integrase
VTGWWNFAGNDGATLVVDRTNRHAQKRPRTQSPPHNAPACCPQGASHLKSELVFCHADGRPFTQSAIEAALRFTCKHSGLRPIGSHFLRHTFCSHLAMRGAAPKAIQELAGHSTPSMTLRYMHLAPSALREAIGLLNFRQPVGNAEAATG